MRQLGNEELAPAPVRWLAAMVLFCALLAISMVLLWKSFTVVA